MNLNEWQREKIELQKECAAENSEASALYQELKSFYTIMSRINDKGVKKANSKAQEIE